ncbi:MAG: hypothetical protein JXP73_10320 [Deltaproteobacteria bacterium]|jgi:hypothetical protein|nr:hypothetical protein [Deltaproteobacteria bacterium]
MTKSEQKQQHKRRLRNYLLDVGLQLRYTVFIIAVAVFLTAVLGSRIYVATQETTRIVALTASVDPATERELVQQFQAKDRVVLWGIAGFGLLLVLTVTAVGIWMTHRIAGPLHNIGSVFARIRDNKLPEDLRNLRKGDELQAFHAGFREMYDAIRARVLRDNEAIEKAIAAIEAQTDRPAEMEQVLEDLRRLRLEKAQSLEKQEE